MQNCKMKSFSVILLIIYQFEKASAYFSHYTSQDLKVYGPIIGTYPWIVMHHYPGAFTTPMTPWINGSDVTIAPREDTPDYRIAEPHYLPKGHYVEHERPYLNSPAYRNYYYYRSNLFHSGRYISQANIMQAMGCYCNTVYRRLTLLAGCAVITTRHALTTATPTMLVVRSYRHKLTLDDILGGWYDHDADIYNSSMYFNIARIHVHPQYTYDYEVNVSHPIPAMFDLALLAFQRTIFCLGYGGGCTYVCNRAGSGKFWYLATTPTWSDVSIVAGFQFIKAFNRRPLPWYRYIIHTKQYVFPCPKSDWQWFHCIYGEYWGRFGFDSGGGMNSAYNDIWRYDGLSGLCAFSLKLRSKQTVHYFTVVDTWPVLDFLYDGILGLIECVWLDYRFEDSKWAAPVLYWGEHITTLFYYGHQSMDRMWHMPFY